MTVINFNNLSRGTVVDNEFSAQGVTVQAWTHDGVGGRAMIFDTANPTGGDYDLATNNLGSALIISEDGDSNDPDDNGRGGTIRFTYENGANVESLLFLDNEEGAEVRFYDENDNLIAEQFVRGTGNNSQNTVDFNVDGVFRMDVVLYGSGAVDNLTFNALEDPLDGFVEGTAGNDTIDVAFTGDPDGDQIDNNDALLPGEGANDDVVLAGGGDDIVRAGAGNDEVYGGEGDDTIFAGGEDDVVYGGEGDDRIEASAGEDVVTGGEGNDDIWAGRDDDVVSAGAGNDTVVAGNGDDVVTGGKGDDTIDGQDGEDEIYGGIGSDSILGGAGNDTLIGGNVDFDGTQDFNELSAGELIDGQYIGEGLTITSGDPTTPVMVFDTDNPTGGDNDLATNNLGNVLILSEDRDGGDPDDNADGGSFFLNFDGPADVSSITLLDVEEGAWVKYFDMNGNLLAQVDANTANNGQTVVGNDISGVFQVEIILGGSGAIDNIEYSINSDDMDGDDTIDGEEGDDYIEGNAGDDVLTGGAGNDAIFGGDDADTIFGGTGDTVDGGAGGNDYDILDLTDQGGFFLAGPDGTGDPVEDSNGNGLDGTVIFLDEDGVPTGETLSFTEIEQIIGDEVNRGPDAANDTATTDEDTAVTIDVLGNDSDPDGDNLTVTEATSPNGDVVINADGTLTFTPNDNFNGDAEITYTIDDGNGGTDTAIVTVTVNPVNDGPVAVDDALVVSQDDVDTDLRDLSALANDSDVDGDTIRIVDVTNGDDTETFNNPFGPAGEVVSLEGTNGGIITVANDGATFFDANGDFDELSEGETVDTTVTYTVSDGNGGTDTATITFTVTGTNDGPIATNNVYNVNDDEAFGDVDGNAISENTGDGVDSDPDGDALTVVAVGGSAAGVGGQVAGDNGGLFTVNADGTVDFDANGDFDFLDPGESTLTSVRYTVDDGNGGQDTALVRFYVTGTNEDPIAVEDTFEANEDDVVVVGNVLDNDSDPDGDPLTVTEVNGEPAGTPVAGSEGGLVTINPDGTVTFDPNGEFEALSPGESVETTVTYTITDPDGSEATETVTITVNGVNDGPEATDNAYVVSLTETTGDVDGNVITDNTGDGVDSDPEGDDLSVSAVDGEAANVGIAVFGDNGGTFTINDDGTVDFDAGDDFDDLGLGETRDTSVDYTIVDENGAEDTATATFTVTGVNDGTVQGTDGNDVINPDIPFVDADGDIVDGDDGILPGDEGTDNDVIDAMGGDDTIDAGQGDDLVFGGAGDDSIEGGNGDDTLLGEDGDDVIRAGNGDDILEGNDGEDMLFGGIGDDTIDAGDDDDIVEGGSGDDTITGGQGNDDLWGASGDDSIDGGTGNDTINTAQGNDIVEGGDGDDTIDTANDQDDQAPDVGYPEQPSATIPGLVFPGYDADEDPNDDLDTVFGGAGNDSIITGDDDDVIFGGSGNDTIDAGFDDDTVDGGTGNDLIEGGEGNDVIEGGAGDDTIFGGLSDPLADLASFPDDEPSDLGFQDLVPENNGDEIFGGAGNDTIFGQDDDDTLVGGTGDDVLDGGVDDDVIDGGDGDDVIIGGQGNDDLTGGLGSDTFLGGNGGDVIVGGEDADLDNDGNSDDVDVLDLTGSNVDFINFVDGDPEAGEVTFLDGSTLTFSEIENVIPCFTPGTTIATPKGERLVEELREGDRIITRDNGIQEIRWVGRKDMSGKALVANPHLKPILVRAGSLGNGLPERDMLVSPNHRCLVASEKTQLYFEEREVLAAAKHLVGTDGIHAVDVMGTSYIHFMFDRHEVVLSNGAWTESFQPGDYSLKGIGNAQRNEIFELFPELQEKQGLEGYQSARRALKKHEAKLLVK